jgi:hypothetical protein
LSSSRRLRTSWGSEALRYVERFGDLFHHTIVGVSDYSKRAELMDQLLLGIEDRRATISRTKIPCGRQRHFLRARL